MGKHVGSKLDEFLEEEGLLAECEAMARSILRSVHETAKGLHKSGVMDDQTICEFGALCESKDLTREQIQALRKRVDDELK